MHTNQRSDIYALGATLYHLLTGQAHRLFGHSPHFGTRGVSTAAPTNSGVPAELDRVILRAMEIEHAERFATAADMRAALNLARRALSGRYRHRTTDLTALAAGGAGGAGGQLHVPIGGGGPSCWSRCRFLLFVGVVIGIALPG